MWCFKLTQKRLTCKRLCCTELTLTCNNIIWGNLCNYLYFFIANNFLMWITEILLILQQFRFACYEWRMHPSINPNILTIRHNQTYTISYDKSPLCVKNTYICCLLFLSAQRCKQIELLLIYSPPMNNKNNSHHRKV